MTPEALDILWRAVLLSRAPLRVPGNAIADRWAASPFDFGPALSRELDLPGGGKVQVFSAAAIRWMPGGQAEVVKQ